MLEISTLPENPIENPQVGEGGAPSSEPVSDGFKAEHGEEGDRNSAANRWPREETMALLKIRSEMDVAFRDTSPKAPLWEQVSRKLAELGYHRNAKKCREKFENIYKYHRRTKEGRCGLMREVIERQETLQRKLMEVLDKCERDRISREEAWKVEELARIKKERELLAQERSLSSAKDEAVLAFLKKIAENSAGTTVQLPDKIFQFPKEVQENANGNIGGEKQECGNNNVNIGNFIHMSSSRWPRDEVEALIRLRTQMDVQVQSQGNGSKGPLWEEISTAMKGLGYDRSAKRCKEKWENINKYFKRMKEKNKVKPMDSKTCPYYHHLEALYSKKPKKVDESGDSGNELRPEELLMHIMGSSTTTSQEERQQQLESSSEDADRENMDQNQGDNEDQDAGYQMVANSSSIAIMS
ncbi:SANT/Myb domain [Sesbania bispinosa]|nr:SANT/Myb domain [Sesbania bispinosa]